MKAVVASRHVGAYHEQAEAMLERARSNRGCLFGNIGRQVRPDSGENIVFVTCWSDLDSLYDWVGVNDLLASPKLARVDLVDELEIQHYETWDSAALEFDRTVPAIERA